MRLAYFAQPRERRSKTARMPPNAASCWRGGYAIKARQVFCELVVAGRDAAIVLYLVEEPLDQVAGFVEVGAEADWVLAVCLRRGVCPCILRGHCGTQRVGIIALVGE